MCNKKNLVRHAIHVTLFVFAEQCLVVLAVQATIQALSTLSTAPLMETM